MVWLGQVPLLAAAQTAGHERLLTTYRSIQPQLSANAFSAPIYLESSVSDNIAQGDIYALLDHPYTDVAEQLSVAEHWCDITSLHFNVKGCRPAVSDQGRLLNLYVGRKYYQRPDQAYHIQYRYDVNASSPDYVKLMLRAVDGPLNTHDYRIDFEAIPVAQSMTFIHFRYAYEYGLAARLAMNGYLATLGKDKVGFTTVGSDPTGEAIYVGGMQGAIERNTMRYFIAIRSYMDTINSPEQQRLMQRLNRWFELTSRYKRQLFELDRDEYLRLKQREYANQLAMN